MTEELAIVNTVDFFTPIVDDPYTYGQIAAANALSDIYAMGAVPVNAMNLVAFPICNMDIEILREILRGGAAKLKEAQVCLVGGHSIEDSEIKYGLAVTGIVHPEKLIRNCGAIPGDRLILTKPLGTGIVNTALKRGNIDIRVLQEVQQAMCTLNRQASNAMKQFNIHACTDVTGYGLLGHLSELLVNSNVGAKLFLDNIPHFPDTLALAKENYVPGGTHKNREYRENMVIWHGEIAEEFSHLLYDPQTSGGLLMAVKETDAMPLLAELHQHGVKDAKIIGDVTSDSKIYIYESRENYQ